MSDLDALVNAIVSEAHKWKNYDTSTTEGFRNRLRALLAAERARAEAAEGREARLREEHRDCRLALEFRDGASCGGVRRDGVCHNHTIIAAMRKHAEDADRFELVLRAAHGIIHEGLHGGKPTDPDHQAQCEKPACRRIRAALAGTTEDLPSTTPRESHPATIIVTEVRRGEPTIHPDEINEGDGTPEGEQG